MAIKIAEISFATAEQANAALESAGYEYLLSIKDDNHPTAYINGSDIAILSGAGKSWKVAMHAA